MSQITVVFSDRRPDLKIDEDQLRAVGNIHAILRDSRHQLLARDCGLLSCPQGPHGDRYVAVTGEVQLSGYLIKSGERGRFFSVPKSLLTTVPVVTGTIREDTTITYHADGRVETVEKEKTELVIKGRQLNKNGESRSVCQMGKSEKTGTVTVVRRATFTSPDTIEEFQEVTQRLTADGQQTLESTTTKKTQKVPTEILNMLLDCVGFEPENDQSLAIGSMLASMFSMDDEPEGRRGFMINPDDLMGGRQENEKYTSSSSRYSRDRG